MLGVDGRGAPEHVDDRSTVAVRFTCETCEQHLTIPLRLVIAAPPAVAGFHYGHGVDLESVGFLEHVSQLGVATASVTDDGGWMAFKLEDELFQIHFDTSIQVTDVTRPDRLPAPE